MSAPLRPAARTRISSSPLPGTGSGCSAAATEPSLMVAASMGADPSQAVHRIRRIDSGTLGKVASSPAGGGRVWNGPRMSLPIPLIPPLWREGRLGLEAAALLRSKVFRGEDVEHAGGQPVLLIPGFLAGDDSLGLMTRWLRKTGHHTRSAGMRANVDCSQATYEKLVERLECLVDSRGERVAIVGQSRGGNFAKVLAVR